jgi:hypothetical protein
MKGPIMASGPGPLAILLQPVARRERRLSLRMSLTGRSKTQSAAPDERGSYRITA